MTESRQTLARRRMVRLLAALAATVAAVPAKTIASAQSAPPAASATVVAGQALAFDRAKGNCLACHAMKGGDVASTVGPELSDMKARFPDRQALFAVIFDEEIRNPQTVMPAFGKNLILDDSEINQIIDFLYTL